MIDFFPSLVFVREMIWVLSLAEHPSSRSREVDLWCPRHIGILDQLKEKDIINEGRVIESNGLLILCALQTQNYSEVVDQKDFFLIKKEEILYG